MVARLLFAVLITISCTAVPSAQSVLNVRDFGALGDGVTDDAPAIQMALDAAQPGQTVYLPSGIYQLASSAGWIDRFWVDGPGIESALILRVSNVTIRGDGPTVSVLRLAPTTKMRVISIASTDVLVSSLGVDGNKSARNGMVGWPNGDVVDAMVYGQNTSANILVTDCALAHGIEDGIGFWMGAMQRVERCHIYDNGTANAGAAGISFSGTQGGVAASNVIEQNSHGIGIAFNARGITISDNTLVRNSGSGLAAGDLIANGLIASFLTVSNNLIQENAAAGFSGVYFVGVTDTQITGNRVLNNFNEGVHVGGEATRSARVSIRDNECSDTHKLKKDRTQPKGIRIGSAADDIEVRGNTCRNNGTSLADQIYIDAGATVNADWQSVNTRSYR